MRSRSLAGALAALCIAAAGCARHTTAPPPPPVVRSVTVTVADSAGAPVPGVQVTALGAESGSGLVTVIPRWADAAGAATFDLAEGAWSVAIEPLAGAPRARVAASTFVVPGGSRAAADTLLVRLVTHSASMAYGTTTLSDATAHSGTSVSTSECLFSVAVTDAAGQWVLDNLPPGTWTIVFFHPGYAFATRTVTISLPASAVAVTPAVLQR